MEDKMAVDAKQYIEQLAQSAGLSDEEKQGLLKAVSNEKFAKGLQEGVELRSDYSRNMDALKADKEKWTGFYGNLLKWKADEEARIAQLLEGGEPDGGKDSPVLTVEAMQNLKTEFDNRLKQTEQNFIAITQQVGEITSDYITRFHEKPDLEAIKKLAIDKQIPLVQAYQEHIAPRVQDLQSKDFEAKLKAAREEGAKDALSKHRLPLDSQPREYHMLLDRDASKQVGVQDYVPTTGRLSMAATQQLRDNFREEWDKSATTSTSGT
jgi:hypothetical protein